MAGERVLDRFDSFDLGKQNTTHIFRLSTFASSRHNYTLIVLANILQRSMKSPGALAAATAASDFMRFLAYFTNLPRSARSRKRIKKNVNGEIGGIRLSTQSRFPNSNRLINIMAFHDWSSQWGI